MWFLWGINFMFKMIYIVIGYAACAYSLYIIAKRNGVKYPYLAFVPIVQYYVIGSICEEYELWGFRIKHLSVVMCLLLLVQVLAELAVGIAPAVIGFMANILTALILHKFFYLFTPQYAFIYAILSMFGRFPLAIILFFIKNMPMQMSAGAYRYPFADRMN